MVFQIKFQLWLDFRFRSCEYSICAAAGSTVLLQFQPNNGINRGRRQPSPFTAHAPSCCLRSSLQSQDREEQIRCDCVWQDSKKIQKFWRNWVARCQLRPELWIADKTRVSATNSFLPSMNIESLKEPEQGDPIGLASIWHPVRIRLDKKLAIGWPSRLLFPNRATLPKFN